MGKKYLNRVSELIRRMVTQLLTEEIHDPRLLDVTVTDVAVNRDTTRAEIYYSIYDEAEDMAEIQAALDGAAGWLRRRMASALRLRNVPELVFIYDPSLAHGAKIDALLHQLRQEEDNKDYDEQNHDSETSSGTSATM